MPERHSKGVIILGMGFTFDDVAAGKGEAENLETMHVLVKKHPHNADRIFSYLGGEEVNNDPAHKHHRYVINFADFPLRREKKEIPWTLMSQDQRNECLHEGIVPHDYPHGCCGRLARSPGNCRTAREAGATEAQGKCRCQETEAGLVAIWPSAAGPRSSK